MAKGPNNTAHHFAEMLCRGFSKKARRDFRKNMKADAGNRAGRHVIKDYRDRYGSRGNVYENEQGGVNVEYTEEEQDGTVNNLRVNIGSGARQVTIPRHPSALGGISETLSQQARNLQAYLRSDLRGLPLQPNSPMPSDRADPRFGYRPGGSHETNRPTTPPLITEDTRLPKASGVSHGRSSSSGSSRRSRESRTRLSSGRSGLRQSVCLGRAHESSSLLSGRETSRDRSRPSGRSESGQGSRASELSHIPVRDSPDNSMSRVATVMAPIGDMTRTFVDGMIIEESEDEESTQDPCRW